MNFGPKIMFVDIKTLFLRFNPFSGDWEFDDSFPYNVIPP